MEILIFLAILVPSEVISCISYLFPGPPAMFPGPPATFPGPLGMFPGPHGPFPVLLNTYEYSTKLDIVLVVL